MGTAGHLQQQEAGDETHGALHQIAGDTGRSADALTQQQCGVAEVAGHHDDLTDEAADQSAHGALAEGLEDQGAYQRHQTLNDQGAGGVVAVAQQQVRQHGPDPAGRTAPPGTQQPPAQQHEAVAQIHEAVHGGGDLHHHRSHAGQCRQHGGHYHRSDFLVGHGLAPHKICSAPDQKVLAIAV